MFQNTCTTVETMYVSRTLHAMIGTDYNFHYRIFIKLLNIKTVITLQRHGLTNSFVIIFVTVFVDQKPFV